MSEAEEITSLAIEFFRTYPDAVVGIELSGNPSIGKFEDFIPSLMKARETGLKVTLTNKRVVLNVFFNYIKVNCTSV